MAVPAEQAEVAANGKGAAENIRRPTQYQIASFPAFECNRFFRVR